MLQSPSSSVPSRLPASVPHPRLPRDDLDFRFLFIGCGMKGTSMEIMTPLTDVKALKKHFRLRTSKDRIQVLTDKRRDISSEDVVSIMELAPIDYHSNPSQLHAIRNVTSNLSNKTVLFVYREFDETPPSFSMIEPCLSQSVFTGTPQTRDLSCSRTRSRTQI